MTADDTDEYADLGAHGHVAHAPAAGDPASASDLDYFSALDAPRWAVVLAAVGLACAGVVLVREAFRLISSALGS